MAEYIERERARHECKYFFKGDEKAQEDCESLLCMLPAADVAPVVHGKWVHPHWKNSNYCYDCSVCGREAMHQEYKWGDKKIYPICPNCGAKMEARHG